MTEAGAISTLAVEVLSVLLESDLESASCKASVSLCGIIVNSFDCGLVNHPLCQTCTINLTLRCPPSI